MTSQVTNGSLKLSSKNYTFSSINFKRGVPSRRDDFKWDYTRTHTLNSTLHVIIYIFITVYSGQNPRNHVNLDVIKFQWIFSNTEFVIFKASLEPSHFFLKSMSERGGSDIQRLRSVMIKTHNQLMIQIHSRSLTDPPLSDIVPNIKSLGSAIPLRKLWFLKYRNLKFIFYILDRL